MSNDNDSHSAFYYYRTLLKMFHVEHIKPKRESFLFGFFSIQDFPNANENHSQMRMNRKWERFANENDSHLTHLLFSKKSARVRQCESEVLFRMLPGNV
jgi:hypothetical protein